MLVPPAASRSASRKTKSRPRLGWVVGRLEYNQELLVNQELLDHLRHAHLLQPGPAGQADHQDPEEAQQGPDLAIREYALEN